MKWHRDFFPTPPEVIEEMIGGEAIAGKVYLDPEGGSGSIVVYLKEHGAKQVLSCENDPELVKILRTRCTVLTSDFLDLTSEQISHVQYVVMNPPFSKGAEHILHAYHIMPAGCKLVALCNAETVKNPYSRSRSELKELVDTYGQWKNLGDCFSAADRKTDVEVALIRLQKPGTYESEFDGFFLEEEVESQANGVISYNVVRDLVNRYVGSIKIYDEQLETAVRLNELQTGYLELRGDKLSISITRGTVPVQRNEFKKELQKAGWRTIFEKLNMQKYATKGLMEDLNRFVEQQDHVPFTMRNVYKMLEIVVGTQASRMDKALLEVFDKVTKHTHENRFNLEGWQTNSHYLLNRRFIMPNVVTNSYGRLHPNSYGWSEPVEDLQKALCYLMGKNYAEYQTLWNFLDQEKETGVWYDWGFFKVKCFKKGTMHLEFLEEKVWGNFNQQIARLKGYPLPEQVKQTRWQKQQTARQNKKPVES